MTISTRDLSKMPDIDALKRLMQSMAMLDAILGSGNHPYYSFNANLPDGKQVGSMENGSGDDFFAFINKHGCFLKGFAHEAPMSPYRDDGTQSLWPGVMDAVPECFADGLAEAADSLEDTTFCIWRQYTDDRWQHGAIKLLT